MRHGYIDYEFSKNIFGDVVAIISGGLEVARYEYDAWGNHKVFNPDGTENTDEDFIGNINPIRYRGYYYDRESGMYYLQTRYYDPEIGQFISPNSYEYLDPKNITGFNLYDYCGYNPVMNVDPTGNEWWKWLIGAAVILGLAIATVATGGAAGGVAGFILAGALKGAVIGAVSSALIGGAVSGISSYIGGEGFWQGFENGASSGFMSGAIIGGITGAITSSLQVTNAAKAWNGVANKNISPYQDMVRHYEKHVIQEGQKAIAKNIVNYTKQAKAFFTNNETLGYLLRNGIIKIAGAPGGIFTTGGKILSFWYILL